VKGDRVPATSGYSEGIRPSTSRDFADTLDHAEYLLALLEIGRERLRLLLILTSGLLFGSTITLALAIAAAASGQGTDLTRVALFAITVLFAVVASELWILSLLPLTRRLQRDEGSIAEILGMLRELLPLIQFDEEMSFVRYQTFKTRLSRFPVTVGKAG
jgi:hypothetical protein